MSYRLVEPQLPPERSRFRMFSRRSVAVLPTLFTLGNLLCGFTAVFIASRADDVDMPFQWTPLTFAAILILIGLVLDGLDGAIARLIRSESDLGEQLDSLADMVTFGVAPAFMVMQLVGIGAPWLGMSAKADTLFDRVALAIAGIYVVCAGLRLARFNIETGENEARSFKGLPTPGAAGTVASLALLHQHFLAHYPDQHWSVGLAAYFMVFVTLMVAITMVSQFRYPHLANRYMRGRAPFVRILGAMMVGLLLVIHPRWGLAVGFSLYAILTPLTGVYHWVMGHSAIVDEDDSPDSCVAG